MSRNNVTSREAGIPLQVANYFHLHFMFTFFLLQWISSAISILGLGLHFRAKEMLHASPPHDHSNQEYSAVCFSWLQMHNFQISTNDLELKRCFNRTVCKALAEFEC